MPEPRNFRPVNEVREGPYKLRLYRDQSVLRPSTFWVVSRRYEGQERILETGRYTTHARLREDLAKLPIPKLKRQDGAPLDPRRERATLAALAAKAPRLDRPRERAVAPSKNPLHAVAALGAASIRAVADVGIALARTGVWVGRAGLVTARFARSVAAWVQHPRALPKTRPVPPRKRSPGRPLLARPFAATGQLARRIQTVATRVALSAAGTGDRMANRAASIETRALARRRRRTRAPKAAPKQPSIRSVREYRHGRTSLKIYRVADSQAGGTLREFWVLSRETPRGRVRLATGTMDELRNLRAIAGQTLRQDIRGQRPVSRTPTPRHSEPGRARDQASTVRQEPEATQGRKPWYSLVNVEGVNRDGSRRTRVVASYGDHVQAKAAQDRNPKLLIVASAGSRPLQPGDVVNIKASPKPTATARGSEPRRKVTEPGGNGTVIQPGSPPPTHPAKPNNRPRFGH